MEILDLFTWKVPHWSRFLVTTSRKIKIISLTIRRTSRWSFPNRLRWIQKIHANLKASIPRQTSWLLVLSHPSNNVKNRWRLPIHRFTGPKDQTKMVLAWFNCWLQACL